MSNQPGQPSNAWNEPQQSWGGPGQQADQEGTQLRPPQHQPSAPHPGQQQSGQPYGQQPGQYQQQPGQFHQQPYGQPSAAYPQQQPQQPQHQASAYPPPSADAAPSRPQLIVVTTDTVAGHELERSIGPVLGAAARSREIGRKEDPATAYPALLHRTRHEAIAMMVEQAQQLGADAVIGLRFDSSEITQTLSEVVAYGTAVTLRRG